MSWNSGGPGPWGSPGGGGGQGGGQKDGQKGGGDGRPPRSPWQPGGGGPSRRPGGGGPNFQPPDLDALIARIRAFFRNLLPEGGSRGFFSSRRGIAAVVLGLVVLWLATGFYRVQPDEQGIVMRFGAYDRTTLPGLNYHIPWPVESVELPAVTRINRTEIGFSSGGSSRNGDSQSGRDVQAESLMLTGDENIIDINVTVFWRIDNAVAFLFNTRAPADTVKAVAESVMREVIGRTPIQPALTQLRFQIETEVLKETQQILNNYKAGVEITQVQLQKVDPPDAVIESFRDVQRANTDAERMRNEAESYRNDIVPRARGDAARITAEAEGARAASVAQATGQSQRFLSVLHAYQAARAVTLQRMYVDTMQDVLSHAPTTIVDGSVRGVVPFLPLTQPPPPAAPSPPPAPPSRTGPTAAAGASATP